MKVVHERKFGKWLAVTNNGRTIDRSGIGGIVIERFLNRPSPLLTNHVG